MTYERKSLCVVVFGRCCRWPISQSFGLGNRTFRLVVLCSSRIRGATTRMIGLARRLLVAFVVWLVRLLVLSCVVSLP